MNLDDVYKEMVHDLYNDPPDPMPHEEYDPSDDEPTNPQDWPGSCTPPAIPWQDQQPHERTDF